MDMSVQDSLPCGCSVVHSNVETVWVELLLKLFTHRCNKHPKVGLLCGAQLEEGYNMLARYHQRMTSRQWILVSESAPNRCCLNAFAVREFTERAHT